ncbi:MAG: GntR family transcriptional regulator [Eubacterium sp.]|nr:GntR family transcriptional regulator [Candidatus Colimonas fimequi]
MKKMIITGQLKPGERIMEDVLCELFQVSRTPIREATRKLEREGLIRINPRHGAYVATISVQDVLEILEVSQDMEGMAAAIAAAKITPSQLDEIELFAFRYNEAAVSGDAEAMIDYDTKFHRAIAKACGNEILTSMIERLHESFIRYRYVHADVFGRINSVDAEHKAIIDALTRGDEMAARVAADVHVSRMRKAVTAIA